MFFAESEWIIDALRPIAALLTTAIDVGAGNASVYAAVCKTDPFTTSCENGTFDLRRYADASCDVRADIADARTVPRWITTFDLVLCTSVLEHVTDIKAAAVTLCQLMPANGYLLITVPRSYPPHRSPIDTGYRPTNRDIESLFSDLAVVHSEIICPPRDKWFHWLIFPAGVSVPRVSCVLLRKVSIVS